ncbi:two-component sensor histidine kinase [Pontibacter ummariensis]|uniref:histidine kinase n=1 Tax=Pontibacter ummariensis TaxID=1610492 RepID=A0A239AY21_9BACT|nr:two-component regulator propeller domain-containing protein [Pontibacter ummariensis]PRY16170.1 two-component sensor histidine kinase [Pontibacter ummariensis]SNS00399.1 Two-component sensor histidine kinase, contains HisKA and HATPase domains [Pontibacter ummariensis]
MYRERVLLLLLLVLASHVLWAQQHNFRSWTLEQGLPQSQVTAIEQTEDGFLWLATRDGLSRFDGVNFQTYTKQDGLKSHNIAALYEDSHQRLWIGTRDAGVLLYNGKSFQHLGAAQGLVPEQISSITEDPKGRLWLASDQGIYYLSQDRFLQYTSLPKLTFTALAHLPDGSLWAGTKNNGLYQVRGDKVTHFTTANSALPHNTITALHAGEGGNLWIGTAAGLAGKSPDGKLRKVPLPNNLQGPHITSFISDRHHNLWIGLQRKGLLKYNGKEFTHFTRQNGLRTPRIASLHTDKEGNLWIGTNGYGLQQYKAPWFVHYFNLGDIQEPRVTAISSSTANTLWLGTDEGDLATLKNGELHLQPTPPWPKGTTLYYIGTGQGNEKWVCSSDGAWLLKGGASLHYSTGQGMPSSEVFHCTTDSSGTTWFATANGVAYFKNGTIGQLPGPEVEDEKANCVYRDSRNRLWAGTQAGIYRIKNGRLVTPPTLEAASVKEVGSITEDSKGNLYFACFNQGVLVLTGDSARLFTLADGLPSESVKTLFADRYENLWVATSRNVLKVRLPPLRQRQQLLYRSYASQNGFRGMEVCDHAITQTADGSVWFGTAKGLTQYNPSLDRPNKKPPELLLSNVMLYSKPTDWESLGYHTDSATGLPENLRLPHTQNHLSFDFHAICYSGPEQVRYKYRLAGLEKQWSPETEQSFTTYSNLSPGTYTFELLAQNNDGYWTAEPLTYTFSIVPPIWRREWFVGVLLLIVAGAVLGVVRLRERSLVKMNSLLEMRVHHRTRLLERKNREKEMLLQEIHHRVKNNLQIVISMLNLQARYVDDDASLDVMRAIRSRVRSMSILHERLYRHSDLEEIDLEEYFLEICDSLYASYGVSAERVALEMELPRIKVNIDSAITLGLIVNELVSNTLKYAFPNDEKGLLRIELKQHDEVQYTLTVSDNGRGLPDDFNQIQHQSFGLKLVSSLSKKLGGHIKFYNQDGTKSILYFVLAP